MLGLFDPKELSAELESQLLFADDPRIQGVVKRLAVLMGLTDWTVRDYVKGVIKPNLKYLHAVAIATDGAVTWPLEPEGFRLVRLESVAPTKAAEPELTDVVIEAGKTIERFRQAVDPEGPGGSRITRSEARELERHLDEVERQVAEARVALKRHRSGDQREAAAS